MEVMLRSMWLYAMAQKCSNLSATTDLQDGYSNRTVEIENLL